MKLYHQPRHQLHTPNLYAVDTETTRFDPPTYGWKTATRIKPFGGHRLVRCRRARGLSVQIHPLPPSVRHVSESSLT